MIDALGFLYETKEMAAAFGKNFRGPARLPHGEDTLVAEYKSASDSDGMNVEVYCLACPAQFFTIKAQTTKNTAGDTFEGFTITTGSGILGWVADTAGKISIGMLACREEKSNGS